MEKDQRTGRERNSVRQGRGNRKLGNGKLTWWWQLYVNTHNIRESFGATYQPSGRFSILIVKIEPRNKKTTGMDWHAVPLICNCLAGIGIYKNYQKYMFDAPLKILGF
jgi:hypothetical protein